eukprot:TRINITY_DN7117_c0_g1_i1.p1 TRINITY_DN7117_c0_g1~~TRINITY_DN7117_c0_g1_i1.p1  ORF type:complete len:129 (-),score=11.98 TRINITY_DN7117_c0_g1_i1:110-496(-)
MGRGGIGSANADMSSDKEGEMPSRRKTKGSLVYNDEQANIRVVIVGELETNCIIITHKISHELIIIDAGGDVSDIIHHANLNQNQIKHVFATHGHFDHILAVPELSVHYKTHNKRADSTSGVPFRQFL